ncbi:BIFUNCTIONAL ASPARTATE AMINOTRANSFERASE AND GLUTAMATE/ASPARTATE-PREPHENATE AMINOTRANSFERASE-RELATED [Salix koriyanagi]|uniref:1-aminocyclopropane-1-carboxylate synthase n=1 Tax=Salix koriyanagi TaxID=2511006 RepID=A0A9Q0Q881_9ROSI|nr:BIFUNCTIONAL ASPARTATE AMINOTRANSFERASE AND GLUTAMATE/ASPARTATE-PREPHENATE AMINOTRANSFERASE-RELATED [Salix koriyanagi]
MVFKLNSQLLSRIASGNGHGEDSPYFDGWKAYEADPHHPTENPNGVIQMGLAENQLCFDLIQDWLKKNPKASICTPEGLNEFREIAIFQDYHGLPEFRNAVANFMGKVRGNRVTYDPDRIVMSGGATGAHETIAFCLADPGEAFLVPTPYYPGFDRDLRWRTGIKLIPVDSDSSNNFKVTIEALENAYEMAQLDNIKVKGLLITNPSNPLGTILDRETLRSIVRFINEKNIHLVCDEIYAATVFSQPDFISVAEILQEDIECNLDLVHVVYSLSKDMGFPGLRVGIIYSYNDAVVSCARKMSSFGLVSTQTQYLVASMLSDNEFVEKFIRESKRRLAARYRVFTHGLDQAGIKCLKTSNAGLFLWMDLSGLLKEQTVEAEMELWRVIIHEVKLNVSPGCSFHCLKPGWFRVCFANMDDQTMHVALSRIKTFVNKEADTKKKPKKSLRWQGSLKLLNTPRIYDDFINSPHSPIPHSPLVRARN